MSQLKATISGLVTLLLIGAIGFALKNGDYGLAFMNFGLALWNGDIARTKYKKSQETLA